MTPRTITWITGLLGIICLTIAGVLAYRESLFLSQAVLLPAQITQVKYFQKGCYFRIIAYDVSNVQPSNQQSKQPIMRQEKIGMCTASPEDKGKHVLVFYTSAETQLKAWDEQWYFVTFFSGIGAFFSMITFLLLQHQKSLKPRV